MEPDYFIVAGDDRRALLRGINYGVYVIARDLDWIHMVLGRRELLWRG